MFLAGEVTSLVLHGAMDLRSGSGESGAGSSEVGSIAASQGGFSGWPVLKDLEGRGPGDPSASRIRMRFLVARVIKGLVEDELVVEPEAVHRQVELLRGELDGSHGEIPEREAWERVLQAAVALEWDELTACLLEWGKLIEDAGHLHGAGEIFRLAFELARFSGSSLPALDSARFLGKILRTRARWEEALDWYGVANGIAEDLGDPGKRAVVLDGLANTFRDRGNLPKARDTLEEVLAIGRETGNRYATAVGHHDLMTVEKLSGDLVSAIQHGWQAVRTYDSREGSLRALFDLSGVLRESGELPAAKDGYSVVADQVKGFEYRVLALDALALIAATEGDVPAYRTIRDRMEAVGWRDLSPVYQGQVLYYRGLSSRALGWIEEERRWLEEALDYAETHELNKLIFDVETALAESAGTPEILAPLLGGEPEPFGEKISGVRSGLRELRTAEVKAGSRT
jgi:tetratricopeptide (TPR) repeat protein